MVPELLPDMLELAGERGGFLVLEELYCEELKGEVLDAETPPHPPELEEPDRVGHKQPKSTRVVKALPRKGVLIEFIGASPSKEWLTKGTKLAWAAARARVIEVFQRLTTLKPAALGAEELTPEELPFLRF
jgi:hypothetical protein